MTFLENILEMVFWVHKMRNWKLGVGECDDIFA